MMPASKAGGADPTVRGKTMTDEQKQTILDEANWCLGMTNTATDPTFYAARLGGMENVLETLGLRLKRSAGGFTGIVEA